MLKKLQRDIIFPRQYTTPQPRVIEEVEGLVQLWHDIGGGERVEAFFLPGFGRGRRKPTVIFTHGNAELIDYWAATLTWYRNLGLNVLLPEYRGYGRSGGEPSEAGIVADCVAFYDVLASREDVDASKIVLHGRSLGGGAVCGVLRERRAAALILESTFTSVPAIAKKMGVPAFVIIDKFDNLGAVEGFAEPMLVLHGASDEVIPVEHGRALAQKVEHAHMETFPCGHNDMPFKSARYQNIIRDFLSRSNII